MLPKLLILKDFLPPPYRLIIGRFLPFSTDIKEKSAQCENPLDFCARPFRGAWGARWHFSRGRSMIEMLGVLAIIGVLSAGGIMGYSAAMEKYRLNKVTEDIRQIIANAQNILGSQTPNTQNTVFHDQLIQAGVVPKEYTTKKTFLENI